MSPRVAIIDYRMSNLYSVKHACDHVGLSSDITSDPGEILEADAAVLPGVGAFGEAMENLRSQDLVSPVLDFIASGKPFMGICLGMQLLFAESEEFGSNKGIGAIAGTVKRFPSGEDKGVRIKVPQIGWNSIHAAGDDSLWDASPLKNVPRGEYMYFVHSLYAAPAKKEVTVSVTEYGGIKYCSGICTGNIFAVQFHPEKSAFMGLRIYEDWSRSLKTYTEE